MHLNAEWHHIKTKGPTDKDSSDEWTNQEDTQQVFGLHCYLQKKKASVFSYISWTNISF